MCVAAIAWDMHPRWQLIAIGNRDEFHARPAAPLARWDDGSGVIAGRDLTGGGTWLGVSETGRFALVTNYRVPAGPQPGRPTRGTLVTDLLAGRKPRQIAAMNPFNLLHADPTGAAFLTNYPQEIAVPLAAGLHGLSNGGFDRPWPKTRALTTALSDWLAAGWLANNAGFDVLLAALFDRTPPPGSDGEPGPDPAHSAVFIDNPVYGTRCSTVVAIDRSGQGHIIERRFDAGGARLGENTLKFAWPDKLNINDSRIGRADGYSIEAS